jgi:thiol:disulfide interchange protein
MSLGEKFLNNLSTHWLPNSIFFILFILFGISLLGAFEIQLPHSTVNKIDRMGDKGGIIGLFFMALTLVVVSFSCTVPFVGSLLISAANGEVTRPLYGMLAYGLPFALVFGGFGLFPSLLKSLPKSGGWLGELKVVFGFAEFALALKFLSNIDLTYHWNLLHRNIFLCLWIIAALIIGLYILGLLRMPKDEKVEKRNLTRWAFALLFLGFGAYMLPGLSNKPLSLLSGILPPISYESGSAPTQNMKAVVNGVFSFRELEEAKAYAKKVNKPLLLDFTGHACANCRKMEENVWIKEDIKPLLQNNFVIASLYVDDKLELPKEQQFISTYDKSEVKTIGDKNMDYEITRFNNNAQPLYVILNEKDQVISGPIAYSSKDAFKAFLEKGIRK